MLEILKILAEKAKGLSIVVMTTMILIYMLGVSETTNNLKFCVGILTFLCVLFLIIQVWRKTDKEKQKEIEKEVEKK